MQIKKKKIYDENMFVVGILTPAASSLFPPKRREFITRGDSWAKNNSNKMNKSNSLKLKICSDGKVAAVFFFSCSEFGSCQEMFFFFVFFLGLCLQGL